MNGDRKRERESEGGHRESVKGDTEREKERERVKGDTERV